MIYRSAFCRRARAPRWRKLPAAQLPTNPPLTGFQSLTVAYPPPPRLRIWVFGPERFGAEAQEFLQIYSNGEDTKEMCKRQGAAWTTGAMNEKSYHLAPLWCPHKAVYLRRHWEYFTDSCQFGACFSIKKQEADKPLSQWKRLKRGFNLNVCLLLVFPVTLDLIRM